MKMIYHLRPGTDVALSPHRWFVATMCDIIIDGFLDHKNKGQTTKATDFFAGWWLWATAETDRA